MVTERIDVVVSERGSRTVRRNLSSIGGSADRSGAAVDFLKRALLVLGGAAILRGLVRLVDTFTNLQNRLRIVTTSTAQLSVVTDELLAISNRTRSSFESSAELFARTALAVRELGISQRETLQFTESLNQAVILSGASATEAQAGIIQLSQGLASGTLRGDELRSVLEQLPAVADVIAKSLGITRGELRELGEQGRITAQIILRAFRESREELAERFATTVPTIGQSFQVLQNKITVFVGRLGETSGVSRALSNALIFLSENVETIARVFGAAAFVIGTVFGVRALGAAIAGVRALTVAIALNPLGALLLTVTTIVGALVSFSDQLRLSENRLGTLADFGVAAFEVLADAVSRFITFFQANFGIVGELFRQVFGDVEFTLEGLIRFTFLSVGRIIGVFRAVPPAVSAIFENIVPAIQDVFLRALNGAIAIVEAGVNRIGQALNSVLDVVGLEGVDTVSLGRLENSAAGAFTNLLTEVGATITAEVQAAEAQALSVFESINARAEQLAQEREVRQQQELQDLEAARMELEATGTTIENLDGTIRGGIRDGLAEITEEFTNLSDVTSDLLVNAFQGAEDALVDFVRTGKLEFGDLVDSILQDLTRLIVRQAITAPLAGLLGGSGNLIGDLFGGLFGFQSGAQGVPADALSVANLPGTDNRLIAARVSSDETIDINRPGEGGGGTNIQIGPIFASDAGSFRSSQNQLLDDAFERAQTARSRNG